MPAPGLPPVAYLATRPAAYDVSSRRKSGRVSGTTSSTPKTSVTKPGLSISAPPSTMSAPSASSRWGIRPVRSWSLSARQARAPSRRISHVPSRLSRTSRPIVGRIPIQLPTLMIT